MPYHHIRATRWHLKLKYVHTLSARLCKSYVHKDLHAPSYVRSLACQPDMKRQKSSLEEPVSPPTTKRKIDSTTTNKAVASFFKPASQKEPEKITWRIVNNSLVIGKYNESAVTRKQSELLLRIAAFDLDDTIITPKDAGNRWARSATSWKWWDPCVPGKLKELSEEGYIIVIISNQSTISLKDNPKSLKKDTLSLNNFKTQIASILRQLDLPISVYAATGQDHYRKPRVGMWEEMKEDFDIEQPHSIDMEDSFYVGDAAGREKTDKRRKDHATSDRDLASNIGIKFKTPEEFFLGAETEHYTHSFEPARFLATTAKEQRKTAQFEKKNDQELVIFCGSPGSGKSSYYWNVLQPLHYKRINQDILKTRDRCLKTAREYLKEGDSVAVDNTNADIETRAHWIKLAQEFKIPIRCIQFTASPRLCEHNDAVRAHNKQMNPEDRTLLPGIAFRSFAQRFSVPKLEEGLQDITKVDFEFAGTSDQRDIWSKYWVSKFST